MKMNGNSINELRACRGIGVRIIGLCACGGIGARKIYFEMNDIFTAITCKLS